MRTYRGKRSWGKIFGYLLAMLMIFSGLALVGYSFLMGDPLASAAIFGKEPPKSGDLSLTVPEMRRVDDVPVFTGPADDENALHDGTLHVDSTGFPWQDGANVYIAGHRMGFPGTASYLVFWDLDNLEAGDKVVLTDAERDPLQLRGLREVRRQPRRLHRDPARPRPERRQPPDLHPPGLLAAPRSPGRANERGLGARPPGRTVRLQGSPGRGGAQVTVTYGFRYEVLLILLLVVVLLFGIPLSVVLRRSGLSSLE